MHVLEKILLDNEEWLMRRILDYATKHDYVKYTSTLLEAWQLSISGLTGAVLLGLQGWPDIPELAPDENYHDDPIAAFGVLEATRHRERGIDFSMFMGLFKYYRQTFHDLISSVDISDDKRRIYHAFLRRCFDRIEIAFSNEWIALGGDAHIKELQHKNRTVVNEKNMFLTLLESVENPVICFRNDLEVSFANAAFLQLVSHDLTQNDLYYAPSDADREERYRQLAEAVPWAVELVRDLLNSEDDKKTSSFSILRGSESLHYTVTSSRLLDVSGKFSGIVVILNDETKQREALQRARENEHKVETILETMPLPLIITSAETGQSMYANHQMSDLIGVSQERSVGVYARDFYAHPDDRVKVVELLLKTGTVYGFEVELVDATGRQFWGALSGIELIYEGLPAHLFVIQDVTEQKKGQEERRKLLKAVDGSPASVVVTNAEGTIEYVNEKFCNISGYTKEEALGKNPRILKSGTQSAEVYKDLWKTISAGMEWRGDLCNKSKHGRKYWEDVSISPVLDEDGEITHYIALKEDITERREAQEALQESEDKYRRIFNSTTDSLFICDFDGVIKEVNRAACETFGYERDELIGISATQLIHPDYRHVFEELREIADSRRFMVLEAVDIHKSGSTFSSEITGAVITYEGGPHLLAMVRDVTEQKKAQLALAKSEERFRSLIHKLHAGIVVHGPDTSIEMLNPMASKLLGLDEHALLGKDATDPAWYFIHEDGRKMDFDDYPVNRVMRLDGELRGLILGIVKNERQDPVWVRVHAFKEYHSDGSLKNIVVHFWNITALKKTADALRASEEQARLIFETANAGMCVESKTGRFIQVNRQLGQMFGYTADELKTMRFDDITHPDDLNISKDFIRKINAGETDSISVEKRYLHKNGDTLYCLVTSRVKRDEAGNVDFLITNVLDISSRKIAEDALRKSEGRLAEAQRIARLGNWELDLDTGLFTWSEEMYDLFGESPDKFTPTRSSMMDHVLESDRAIIQSCLDTSLTQNRPYEVEYRIQAGDGEQRVIHCRGELIVEMGKPVLLKGTAQDVTVRKEAERALQESEQFQRLLLQSIGAGVITVNPEGLIIENMNPIAIDLIGESAERLVGQSINELCWQNWEGQCTLGLPAMDDKQVEEFVLLRPDGGRLPVTRTTVYADVRGEQRYVLVIFDVTDRKALERQLNLAQKLEAIGSLAAGIAHEINTPVQYISSNMTYLEKAIESMAEKLRTCTDKACCSCSSKQDDASQSKREACKVFTEVDQTLTEIPEAISDCQEGIARVSEIVLSMRKFSHPDKEEARPVDINSAIENTVTISRNEWKYVADVTTDFADELPPVRCTPGDCNQVLLNIVVNAAHAISEMVENTGSKGKIHISTSYNDGYVEVRIADTGGGIPEDIQDKVFDPFFTTKEVGRGTGQGLAITHSILERYSGSISFTTETGKGTEFLIKLTEYVA